MKVSIITVVYNNKNCIFDCLQSVLNQNYPNIEVIVIDGGSTDGTQQVIESFSDQLTYYTSEKDKGLFDALNKGISKATGDVIGILHSDDLFYSDGTISQIAEAFNQSKADLVYGDGMYVDREDTRKIKRIYTSKEFHKKYLNFGWIPLHTTIFVKRELFQKYGLYVLNYPIASDYEISLRWFSNPAIKTYYLNKWIVKMRLGGQSTTINLQKKKSVQDLEIIHRYHLWGWLTLGCKIARKIPQYILPKIIKYK